MLLVPLSREQADQLERSYLKRELRPLAVTTEGYELFRDGNVRITKDSKYNWIMWFKEVGVSC
jgi:hypothetical protein